MTQTAETEGTLSVLMQKIERLEDTAKRSIELSLGSVSEIPKEKIISPEQCEWTLKNCAIFRHWINDLDPAPLDCSDRLVIAEPDVLNHNIHSFGCRLVEKNFAAMRMKIAGYDVSFFDVVAAKNLCDCDFTAIIANSNPANTVLYVNDYAAHRYYLSSCRDLRGYHRA